jgi:hypothetical protein
MDYYDIEKKLKKSFASRESYSNQLLVDLNNYNTIVTLKEVVGLLAWPTVVYDNKSSFPGSTGKKIKGTEPVGVLETFDQIAFEAKYRRILEEKKGNGKLVLFLQNLFRILVKLTLAFVCLEFLKKRVEVIDFYCREYSDIFSVKSDKQKIEKLLKTVEELLTERVEGLSLDSNQIFTLNYGLSTPKRVYREYYEFWQLTRISFLKNLHFSQKIIPFRLREIEFSRSTKIFTEKYLNTWIVDQFKGSLNSPGKPSAIRHNLTLCQDSLFLNCSKDGRLTDAGPGDFSEKKIFDRPQIHKKIETIKGELACLEKEHFLDMKKCDSNIEQLKQILRNKRLELQKIEDQKIKSNSLYQTKNKNLGKEYGLDYLEILKGTRECVHISKFLPELIEKVFGVPYPIRAAAKNPDNKGTTHLSYVEKKFKCKTVQKVYAMIHDEVLGNTEYWKGSIGRLEHIGLPVKKSVTKKAGFSTVLGKNSGVDLIGLVEKMVNGISIDY